MDSSLCPVLAFTLLVARRSDLSHILHYLSYMRVCRATETMRPALNPSFGLGNAPIDLDWDTLYRIYENIRNDVRDRGEMAELFDGKRQCSRFTYTADYAARHEGWDTPPNPMDISEARKLVLNAAAKWVRSKV